jgi:hypothetical protein
VFSRWFGVVIFKYSLWVTSLEVTRTPPIIFSAVRCQVSPATLHTALLLSALSSPCFSFHTSVPTFCRGCHENLTDST